MFCEAQPGGYINSPRPSIPSIAEAYHKSLVALRSSRCSLVSRKHPTPVHSPDSAASFWYLPGMPTDGEIGAAIRRVHTQGQTGRGSAHAQPGGSRRLGVV